MEQPPIGASSTIAETYISFEKSVMDGALDRRANNVQGWFADADELFGDCYVEPFKKTYGNIHRYSGGHVMNQVAAHQIMKRMRNNLLV